jgi:uncharacterized DUF497 family protein
MDFEWDEDKRQPNIAKHGVDFLRARHVFDGRPRYDVASPRGSEHRILSVSEVDGVIIAVAWETCRIILARRASDEEKREYHQVYG